MERGVAVAVAEPWENDSDDRLTGSTLERANDAALAEVGEGTVTGSERSDDAGHAYEIEVTLESGEEIEVELDEKFGVVRVDRDDDGRAPASAEPTVAPITDAERTAVEAAALAEVGAGTVTELERSDDADHAWEVELTLADGTDVDIELDESLAVTRVDR